MNQDDNASDFTEIVNANDVNFLTLDDTLNAVRALFRLSDDRQTIFVKSREDYSVQLKDIGRPETLISKVSELKDAGEHDLTTMALLELVDILKGWNVTQNASRWFFKDEGDVAKLEKIPFTSNKGESIMNDLNIKPCWHQGLTVKDGEVVRVKCEIDGLAIEIEAQITRKGDVIKGTVRKVYNSEGETITGGAGYIPVGTELKL